MCFYVNLSCEEVNYLINLALLIEVWPFFSLFNCAWLFSAILLAVFGLFF